MIFEISGNDFKSLVERISVIVPKKTYNRIFQAVKFSTKNNKLYVQATNGEDFATIKIHANIYEDGYCWVYLDDLKKITGIADCITVKSDDNKFEIRSNKKSYEVNCYDFSDDYIVFPEVNTQIMCSLNSGNFVKYLSHLDCMRSQKEDNKILNSFCLDFPNGKIVVIDGHRIGIANIIDNCMLSNIRKEIIINCNSYKNIKSLVGKNNDLMIDVYSNDKFAKFEGNFYHGEWVLITKLVEGVYYNYNKLISESVNNYDYIFKVDCNELKSISKEYNKVCRDYISKPMIFYSNNGNIATGFQTDNYKTSDKLDSVMYAYGDEKEWYAGFNPRYINDACNVFDNKIEIKGKYSKKTPILIYDDTYEIMILPINIEDNEVLFVKSQVV